MNHQPVLSHRYNLSLGYLPGAVAVLTGLFTSPETALYAGTGTGLLFILACWQNRPLLLYTTTAVLSLLLFLPLSWTETSLPLFVEGGIFIPALGLLLFGRSWTRLLLDKRRHRLVQSIEAAIVSARILFILVLTHGLIALLTLLLAPAFARTSTFLTQDVPLGVLILPILLNQIGICYFNKHLKQKGYVPVVNAQGKVIGRRPLLPEILHDGRNAIYPVVRIAITAYNMLYLAPRPETDFDEPGKNDLPLEGYLIYGENISQAARRILHGLLPQASLQNLHYHFKYFYRDDTTHRLVFLCTFELENDDVLRGKGKLWTFRQIKQDLGKHYFSKFLEHEYEPLKDLIYTREKYKES